MPRTTVTTTNNAAIAADPARTYLEFSLKRGTAPVRFSYGATFVDADSQILEEGVFRACSGTIAQSAISFGIDVAGTTGVVETSIV